MNVGPHLDPNVRHSDSVSERLFLKKLILKKVSRQQHKHVAKLPACKELKIVCTFIQGSLVNKLMLNGVKFSDLCRYF